MRSVLVVDDEPDVRLMVRLMLESEGWDVGEAGDGGSALRMVRDNSYRAVVLDQRMPGMTGLEVAHRLRADGYRGAIIMFSAVADDDLAERVAREVNLESVTLNKSEPRALLEAVLALAA